MAETITLTPTAVYAPRPGKKYASIKVGQVYYSFDPAKIPLSSFQQGVPATFEYITTEQGYNNITKFVGSSTPQPSQQQSAPQQYRQSMDPGESMKITRLAIAKSCIEGNQTIAAADMWLNWVLQK